MVCLVVPHGEVRAHILHSEEHGLWDADIVLLRCPEEDGLFDDIVLFRGN
jgi:hypothetical protein